MKQFSLILIFTLLAGIAFGQGNLQFNRVVNYTINTPLASGLSQPNQTLTITVPAGKVLKIESAHISYNSSTSANYNIVNTSNTTGTLSLNGGIIAAFNSGILIHAQTPIWLAEGSHTFYLSGFFNSSSQYQWNAFVSGIEFNILP